MFKESNRIDRNTQRKENNEDAMNLEEILGEPIEIALQRNNFIK